MKKFILLPALGILSVALFSFKSSSSDGDGKIIHCDDGTVIIPSSVPISLDDQRTIVSVLSSYGDDCGYAAYTDERGTKYIYHPTPVSALAELDKMYGSDLYGSSTTCSVAKGFWLFSKSETTSTKFKEYKFMGSSITVAIADKLDGVLAKYE